MASINSSDMIKLASTLLCDPNTENLESPNTDRIGVDVAPSSTLVSQSTVQPSEMYTGNSEAQLPTTLVQDSGGVNVQKYVLIKTVTWDSTKEYGSELLTIELPKDLTTIKFPIGRQSQPFTHMRSKFEFVCTMNANPGMRGALALVYQPEKSFFHVDTYLNFPNMVINASVNTDNVLKIPYVSDTPYVPIVGKENGSLKLVVLAKLSVPTGANTEIDIAVYGRVLNPEFICQKILQGPNSRRTKQIRKKKNPHQECNGQSENVRVVEGQAALFMANQLQTSHRPRIALGPEDPDFVPETCVAQTEYKDLLDVAKIPGVIKLINFNASSTSGHIMYEENMSLLTPGAKNNLGFISRHYRFFSGKIRFTAQVFASKLTQGRFVLAWAPNVDVTASAIDSFALENVSNTIYTVCDIGLNSSFTLEIPYLASTTLRPVEDFIGRLQVFVLNRLTYTVASPQNCAILLYISAGDDFRLFYPYATKKFEGIEDEWEHDYTGSDWDGPKSSVNTQMLDDPKEQRVRETPNAKLRNQVMQGALGTLENTGGDPVVGTQSTFVNMQEHHTGLLDFSQTRLSEVLGRAAYLPKVEGTVTTYMKWNARVPETSPSLFNLTKLFVFWTGPMNLHVWTPTLGGSLILTASLFEADDMGTLDAIMSYGSVVQGGNRPITLNVPFYYDRPVKYVPLKSNTLGFYRVQTYVEGVTRIQSAISATPNTRFFFLQSPPTLITEEDPFPDFARMSLMLSGDVEENPGPQWKSVVVVETVDGRNGVEVNWNDGSKDQILDENGILTHMLDGQIVPSRPSYATTMAIRKISKVLSNDRKIKRNSFKFRFWLANLNFFQSNDQQYWDVMRNLILLSGDVEKNPGPDEVPYFDFDDWIIQPFQFDDNFIDMVAELEMLFEQEEQLQFEDMVAQYEEIYDSGYETEFSDEEHVDAVIQEMQVMANDIEENPGPIKGLKMICNDLGDEAIMLEHSCGLEELVYFNNMGELRFQVRRQGSHAYTVPCLITDLRLLDVWALLLYDDNLLSYDCCLMNPVIGQVYRETNQRWFRVWPTFRSIVINELDEYLEAMRKERLLQCGDVESNPGPWMIMKKEDELFGEWAITDKKQMITIVGGGLSVLRGRPITFSVEPFTDVGWELVSVVSVDEEKILTRLDRFQQEMDLSFVFNKNAVFEKICQQALPTTTRKLEVLVFILILGPMTFMMCSQGFRSKLVSTLTGVDEDVVESSVNILNLFKKDTMDKLMSDIKDEVMRNLVRFIIKSACYGILLMKTRDFSGILAIGALVAMEVSDLDVFSMMKSNRCDSVTEEIISKVSGENLEAKKTIWKEVKQYFSKLKNERIDVKEKQGIRDFNDVSLAMRNCTFWLNTLQMLFKWLAARFCPDEIQRALKELKKREEDIIETLSTANELCEECVLNHGVLAPIEMKRYKTTLSKLIIYSNIANLVVGDPRAVAIRTAKNNLLRLSSPHVPIGDEVLRMEPCAFHFYGEPGCGKSLLMIRLAKAAGKMIGSDVYSQPMASQYMDGYNGQKVHVFDDFLQGAAEEEVPMFVNLVSGAQYRIPMAALNEKGMYYNGEIILTSGNVKAEPMVSIKCPKALKRRLDEIRVRVKPYYMYYKNDVKVLNLQSALDDGSFEKGNCWEFSFDDGTTWKDGNFDELLILVMDDWKKRKSRTSFMERLFNKPLKAKQGAVSYDLDEMIEELDRQAAQIEMTLDSELLIFQQEQFFKHPAQPSTCTKIRVLWDNLKEKFKPISGTIVFFAKVVTTISAILTLIMGASVLWNSYRGPTDPEMEEQRAYGQPVAKRVVSKRFVKEKQGEDFAEYAHLYENCVELEFEDRKHSSRGYALTANTIITFSHGIGSGQMKVKMSIGEMTFEELDYHMFDIYNESGNTEMTVIELVKNTGYRFKDMTRHISPPYYKAHGIRIGVRKGQFTRDVVKNLQDRSYQMYDTGEQRYGHVEYDCITSKGDCGDIIVQKIRGTWKIVAMHTCGSHGVAAGFKMCLFRKETQGMIESKLSLSNRDKNFIPGKSSIIRSPLYGEWEVTKGPAVLSKFDDRIRDLTVDSVLKKNAEKYNTDCYDVDEIVMDEVVDRVLQDLTPVVSVGEEVDWEESISGVGINPIDMGSSAGYKYKKQGMEKKDLFKIDAVGTVTISEKFQNDLCKIRDELETQQIITNFSTSLKDELRDLKKIYDAKTRVIESCEVDYTVLYRKIMSTIYRDIYDANCFQTGIAVGIDPLGGGHMFERQLNSYSFFLQGDFSGFDGSLPTELMRRAVSVLAELHHNPDLVVKLHEPVVRSQHIVYDEKWIVQGGMPSGAPCTSVLNSICNLLAIKYLMLTGFGFDLEEMKIVVYGDDFLICTNQIIPEDFNEIFPKLMNQKFGMKITSSDKGDSGIFVVERENVEFLKRKFQFHEELKRMVMKLEKNTIIQSMMYMRSPSTYQGQMDSLTLELAQHGKQEYEEIRTRTKEKLMRCGVHFPLYGKQVSLLRDMT